MPKLLHAGIAALALLVGSSPALAQSRPADATLQRLSEADLNALTDARVTIVKTALQLTADQEKYWPAIEDAIRSRAKQRQTRLATVGARVAELRERSPMEALRDRNPIEFLNKRSEALAQRAAELKKLADAWQPLYQTLNPDQKRRLGLVAMLALRELRDAVEQGRLQAGEDEDDEN